MTEAKGAAVPQDPAVGSGTDKVPAYSWYALSVLVLIYVLNFIDRQKIDRLGNWPTYRHGLDRAEKILGVTRNYFFLAGNESNLAGTFYRHRAVVVFARQQSQRKTNHATAMRQQTLHREIGFPRIGRPQDRRHPRFKS